MPDEQLIKSNDWKGRTGGGSFGQYSLLLMIRVLGLRTMYFFMAFSIPFYVVFNGTSRKAIMKYYQKIHKYSTLRSLFSVFKNNFAFGKIFFDRIAMMTNDRRFDINFDGNDAFTDLIDKEKGFIIGGSHVGNFELAGYLLHQDKKKMNSLVFGGESEAIQEKRLELLRANGISTIVPMTDLSHIFELKNALDRGEIIGMPCDRNLGSRKTTTVTLNGVESKFPLGPFMIAAQMDVEMIGVFVMRDSFRRYTVYVRKMSRPDIANTKLRADAIAKDFARNIEEIINKYPDQWFNFFDFWGD